MAYFLRTPKHIYKYMQVPERAKHFCMLSPWFFSYAIILADWLIHTKQGQTGLYRSRFWSTKDCHYPWKQQAIKNSYTSIPERAVNKWYSLKIKKQITSASPCYRYVTDLVSLIYNLKAGFWAVWTNFLVCSLIFVEYESTHSGHVW